MAFSSRCISVPSHELSGAARGSRMGPYPGRTSPERLFMVCTGRGEELTDITPQQYEEVLGYLVDCQDQYKDMLVRARCAPHFKRLAYEKIPPR